MSDAPDLPETLDPTEDREEDFADEAEAAAPAELAEDTPRASSAASSVIKSPLEARADRPGRLSHDRRRRRGALRRQGQMSASASRATCAPPAIPTASRAWSRLTAVDGVRLDRDRDRSAAARDQSHQADEAALQRADARRQVVSLYLRSRATIPRRRSPSIAARATARAIISARSPAPGPSIARSMRCNGRFCCAPAPIPSTKTARGPACSIRSSAARPLHRRNLASPIMPSWYRRRMISCRARAARCASCSPRR